MLLGPQLSHNCSCIALVEKGTRNTLFCANGPAVLKDANSVQIDGPFLLLVNSDRLFTCRVIRFIHLTG